jgi:hypothetical protein
MRCPKMHGQRVWWSALNALEENNSFEKLLKKCKEKKMFSTVTRIPIFQNLDLLNNCWSCIFTGPMTFMFSQTY